MSICTLRFREVRWYVQTLWIVRRWPPSPQFAVRYAATCIVSDLKQKTASASAAWFACHWASGQMNYMASWDDSSFRRLGVHPYHKRANADDADGAINYVEISMMWPRTALLISSCSKFLRNTHLYKQDFLRHTASQSDPFEKISRSCQVLPTEIRPTYGGSPLAWHQHLQAVKLANP